MSLLVDPSSPQPKRTIVQRKWVQVFPYDKWLRSETSCLAFCCRLVARKFHEKWDTNDEARPHIKHIFYVKHLSPHAQTHLHQYSNYRWITLTSKLFSLNANVCDCSSSVGNVQELFHGTQRTCRTGDHTEWVKPCHHSDCFMCSILKCSFNLNLAGTTWRVAIPSYF